MENIWKFVYLLKLVLALILYKIIFVLNLTVSILFKVATCAKLQNLVFGKKFVKVIGIFSSSFPNSVVWGLYLLLTIWLILLFSFRSFSSTQFAIFLHFLVGFLSFLRFLKNLIERDFLFAVRVSREEEDEEERRISHYKSQLNDLRV